MALGCEHRARGLPAASMVESAVPQPLMPHLDLDLSPVPGSKPHSPPTPLPDNDMGQEEVVEPTEGGRPSDVRGRSLADTEVAPGAANKHGATQHRRLGCRAIKRDWCMDGCTREGSGWPRTPNAVHCSPATPCPAAAPVAVSDRRAWNGNPTSKPAQAHQRTCQGWWHLAVPTARC